MFLEAEQGWLTVSWALIPLRHRFRLYCAPRGRVPASQIERRQVDVKEEPGRRGPGGRVTGGSDRNDPAARYLAGEMACMANSPGGGAVILGVADDGTWIGTGLDGEWLRHRIWQLTDGKLTIAVREGDLNGTRILVLTTHEAIEPIRFEGKIKWRLDDNCVEVDPTSWHSGKLARTGIDWSAQPSGHMLGAGARSPPRSLAVTCMPPATSPLSISPLPVILTCCAARPGHRGRAAH